jgi:hypothetical protein
MPVNIKPNKRHCYLRVWLIDFRFFLQAARAITTRFEQMGAVGVIGAR